MEKLRIPETSSQKFFKFFTETFEHARKNLESQKFLLAKIFLSQKFLGTIVNNF